jgi:dTDP-4-dehydrorhamnose reductase
MRVLVFGPTGMLGHEMVKVLRDSNLEVTTAGRSSSDILFDVGVSSFSQPSLKGFDYIVNCIGLTTHNIDELDSRSVDEAKLLNTEFSRQLASYAEEVDSKVIQIATDCVFSGAKGDYVESDIHDATDVYGKSKSAGEIKSARFMHIRSSIVGRELRGNKSLLEWVIRQPEGANVPGFIDRMWNGVTTTAFSKIVKGILVSESYKSGTWHLVPKDKVSKFELVSLLASSFGRRDLQVRAAESGLAKDLTLSTEHPEVNHFLWHLGGYQRVPTIGELIAEIAGQDASI